MKKFIFAITILLAFCLFSYLGYQIAAHSDNADQLPSHVPYRPINAKQMNFVLLRVDQIKPAGPALRSVWLAIRFHSENQTVLTFSPLYPNAGNDALGQDFGLSERGEPSPGFWRKLDDLQVKWDGYLLVDDRGFTQLTDLLQPTNLKIKIQDEASLLEVGCSFLAAQNGDPAPDIDWGTFSPHMSTDIAFNDIMAEWSRMTNTQPPVRCEFPGQ